MTAAVVFALTLVVAVMVSGLAHRSIVSTTVVFLIAGVLVGPVSGLADLAPDAPLVATTTRLALFTVLFVDGSGVPVRRLRAAWRLPVRALAVGLPLTVILGAVASKPLLGIGWSEAVLVAAVLAPTDPVFAASIIGRDEVPPRVRHLLNVESGLNDGLVLPVVIVALEVASDAPVHVGNLLAEVTVGLAVGVGVPVVLVAIGRALRVDVVHEYVALQAVAVGAVVYTSTEVLGGNLFIAAFVAGITVASRADDIVGPFRAAWEPAEELLKLLAVFLFGMVLERELFAAMTWRSWLLVAVLLLTVRPMALGVAMIGSHIGRPELLAAAWFGPKGFASVVYGLLVLGSAVDHVALDFGVIAATIGLSMLLHSSTDVPIAQWFERREHAGGLDREGSG